MSTRWNLCMLLKSMRSIAAVVLVLLCPVWAQSPEPIQKLKVGVYYFPGWKEGARGLQFPKPWDRIKPFPQIEPLLGWYPEGEVAVMEQHLQWMTSYGLSYVVFDWYWDGRSTFLEHALNAYFQAPTRAKVPFALLWANHDKEPQSVESFRGMVRYWVNNYFRRPEYFAVGERPVVFVLHGSALEDRARGFGSTTKVLIDQAQAIMREAGLPDIYFVAGSHGVPGFTTGEAKRAGYAGYSAYNYGSGPGGRPPVSHDYRELHAAYKAHWDWFMRHADLPYVLPMTTGWDRRPWGGSTDPLHDGSTPTPEQFLAHLAEAKALMQAYPGRTEGLGVVCCWNEFGEGSILEPTKGRQFSFLEAFRSVFSRP